MRALDNLGQGAAGVLHDWDRRGKPVDVNGRHVCAGYPILYGSQNIAVWHRAEMLSGQVFQLFQVQPGRSATDAFQIEPGTGLFVGKKLVVTMAPPQPRKIIPQRLRRVSHCGIFLDASRAMPFGQLFAIGAVDQGNMRPYRLCPTHRIVDLRLTRGIVQMIVAPDHMRDTHVMIVHHNRQHISRCAIGAQQHHVVQLIVAEGYLTLNSIGDYGRAVARGFQTNDRWRVRMIGWIGIAPGRLEQGRGAGLARGLPKCLDLFLGRETAIGMARGQHRMRHLGMTRDLIELADGLAIVVKTKPFQTLKDRIGRFRGRAFAIGVLDPQQELPAMTPREQPVEQRRPRRTDVHRAGGGRGDTGHHGGDLGFGHGVGFLV